jgi:hypothetical protein
LFFEKIMKTHNEVCVVCGLLLLVLALLW